VFPVTDFPPPGYRPQGLVGQYGIVHCASMCFELSCKNSCKRKEVHESIMTIMNLISKYKVVMTDGTLYVGDLPVYTPSGESESDYSYE
jgi:hypothetical protein